MALKHKNDNGVTTICLEGRIDAVSAPVVEKESFSIIGRMICDKLILDCDDLIYISSAGIRMVLRLAKRIHDIHLTNVSLDVYEVFDMCGLTEMLDITKARRRMSVEGCQVIGQGAKGVLYRIDPETICKVYRNPDSLAEINRERELARAAFVAGIPTAIPYDVVRVGDGYGSVFELLDADSLGDLLSSGRWDVERVAEVSAELLRQMAETEVDPEVMPSIRDQMLVWVDDAAPVLKPGQAERLRSLVEAIPDVPFMVHGDFHINNVMVQADEPLLIDMDTLSHGNPVFDLAATYSAYVGRGLENPQSIENFLRIPYELSCRLWDLVIHDYYPDYSEDQIREAENKVRILSAARLIGWPVRHNDMESPRALKTFEVYGAEIDELLDQVDSLAL